MLRCIFLFSSFTCQKGFRVTFTRLFSYLLQEGKYGWVLFQASAETCVLCWAPWSWPHWICLSYSSLERAVLTLQLPSLVTSFPPSCRNRLCLHKKHRRLLEFRHNGFFGLWRKHRPHLPIMAESFYQVIISVYSTDIPLIDRRQSAFPSYLFNMVSQFSGSILWRSFRCQLLLHH